MQYKLDSIAIKDLIRWNSDDSSHPDFDRFWEVYEKKKGRLYIRLYHEGKEYIGSIEPAKVIAHKPADSPKH